MPHHDWSDDTVDWRGISDAGYYIGLWLRKWARIPVTTIKEKWGTPRIYCWFGWYQFHSITHPGYVSSRYPKWLWSLDCRIGTRIIRYSHINHIVVPIQKLLYRWRYSRAIKRWPHLAGEILTGADYPELLKGLHPDFYYRKSLEGDNCYEFGWNGYSGGRTDWTEEDPTPLP